MSDRVMVALAASVWIGAVVAQPLPRVPAGVVLLLAVVSRRPTWSIVAAGCLASALAAASWSGLASPPARRVVAWATIVRDPETVRGAVNVELRVRGKHVDAWAHGAPASLLRGRAAGEMVHVSGSAAALSVASRARLAPRHVAARLSVERVDGWRTGSPASRVANVVRRDLERGAVELDPDARSLFLGVVLGDDRGRSEELTADFRAAGLSHLLAVSGQNVAFLLALAAPLLGRLGIRSRWAVTLGLVTWFGVLTRWEPSVVRAAAMAAIAATAAREGRPTSGLRVLALAVAATVLVDPLLVHAVGFQLSVAATAGIAVLARPLTHRLPGPASLRSLLGTTIAAQAGVLPIAIPTFGGVPFASIPANLLAVPVAAPLTGWGLTAGWLAGRVGAPYDRWLHVPTVALTGWLEAVARWAARLPLGRLGSREVVVLLVGAAFVVSGRWSWRWARAGSTSRPRSW